VLWDLQVEWGNIIIWGRDRQIMTRQKLDPPQRNTVRAKLSQYLINQYAMKAAVE
jgi:hypothetical protein